MVLAFGCEISELLEKRDQTFMPISWPREYSIVLLLGFNRFIDLFINPSVFPDPIYALLVLFLLKVKCERNGRSEDQFMDRYSFRNKSEDLSL